MERRYDGVELRIGNILLALCTPTKRACSFDTVNFFIFYRIVMEKIGMKPSFKLLVL